MFQAPPTNNILTVAKTSISEDFADSTSITGTELIVTFLCDKAPIV